MNESAVMLAMRERPSSHMLITSSLVSKAAKNKAANEGNEGKQDRACKLEELPQYAARADTLVRMRSATRLEGVVGERCWRSTVRCVLSEWAL